MDVHTCIQYNAQGSEVLRFTGSRELYVLNYVIHFFLSYCVRVLPGCMYVLSMYTCVAPACMSSEARRRQRISWNWNYIQMVKKLTDMWVLGSELRSTGRATSALNFLLIFPAPLSIYKMMLELLNLLPSCDNPPHDWIIVTTITPGFMWHWGWNAVFQSSLTRAQPKLMPVLKLLFL